MEHEVMNEKRDYVVGIDIGSANVTMVVGYKRKDGLLDIRGVERQSVGDSVKDGVINHIGDLGSAISAAKSALESDLNITINDAFVGISGTEVNCAHYEDFVYVNSPNNLITEADVRDLTERINKVSTSSEYQIVERVLQRYIVDDRQEVKNPVGAVGSKLSAEYLLVLCNKKQIQFVKQALFQAGMEARHICINPMVQHLALLNKEEREEGIAIIDIGGDLTDISVVRQGKVRFFTSLPIGASCINDDLSQFVSASKENIERLKKSYGEAIAENISPTAVCQVQVFGRSRKILQRNVVEIIEERLKDIARFALQSLKDAKLSSKVPCGVVLTGGTTYLSNIEELFSREMNMEVRCADNLYGIDEESKGKMMVKTQSVVLGVMLHGMQANLSVADKQQHTLPHTLPPTPPTQPTPPTPTPTPLTPPTPPTSQTYPEDQDKRNGTNGTTENNGEQTEEKPPKENKPKKKDNPSIGTKIKDFFDRLVGGNNEYL